MPKKGPFLAEICAGLDHNFVLAPPEVCCLTCPACGTPPHWDDGFTPTADRAECPSLTMLVHDGDDTLSLCALSLSVLAVACHADDVR